MVGAVGYGNTYLPKTKHTLNTLAPGISMMGSSEQERFCSVKNSRIPSSLISTPTTRCPRSENLHEIVLVTLKNFLLDILLNKRAYPNKHSIPLILRD